MGRAKPWRGRSGRFKCDGLDSAEDFNIPQWGQLGQNRAWEEFDLIGRIQDADESAKFEMGAHKKEDAILRVMAMKVNYFYD